MLKFLALCLLTATLSGCSSVIIGGVAGGGAAVACVKYHVWPCQ